MEIKVPKQSGKRLPLTANEFDRIKELTNLDVPIKIIEKITGRGPSTIDRVKRMNTFADYEEYRKAWAAKQRQQKHSVVKTTVEETPAEEKEGRTARLSTYFETLIQQTEETNMLLQELVDLCKPVAQQPALKGEEKKSWPFAWKNG